MGAMIGLGILRTPGEIATVVTDPWTYTALWVVGGLFVLMSTGVAAELVGMTPRSGGNYVLVRQAFGTYPGFLIGWVDWLSFCGNIALKATVLVEYLNLLLPFHASLRIGVSILITTIFAALQLRGVLLTARVQQIAAAAMAAIVVGFTLALLFGHPVLAADLSAPANSSLAGWGLVAAAVIFTYDGWLGACYFGGEIKGGGGEVARACVRAVIMVFVLYVGLMAALAFSVPLAALAGEDLALATALDLAVSPVAATIVAVAAILILLAHQNLHYMAGPRVLYALSTDRLGADRAAAVGSRGNPVFAVLLTWMVSVGLILIGGFEFLLNLCVFFFIFLYVALIAGVAILRRKEPDADRPFRAWGHPVSTAVCLLGWLGITVFQALSAPETALYAAIMVAVSLPAYLWLRKVRHLDEPQEASDSTNTRDSI